MPSCSSTCQIHVGDIGTQFVLTIKDCGEDIIDISTVISIDIIFSKPDGTTLTKVGAFYTDGTDGKVKYVIQDDDLDMAGNWKIQAFVDFGSTEFYSTIQSFKVYGNL